ncbi:hypothetical protein A0H81_01844 [Grifola frondosa]|uniref:Uncharacterized protein n=1 Tax=Grifola frondosa TaxID=5627 RepID=A0A1C7MMG3_GRIFR|nr:hypothetical protein A0H81_01844 [Grifola frondosa]
MGVMEKPTCGSGRTKLSLLQDLASESARTIEELCQRTDAANSQDGITYVYELTAVMDGSSVTSFTAGGNLELKVPSIRLLKARNCTTVDR